MDKLVFASMRRSAGKTSVIVGMTKVLNKKIVYLKPFGDRPVYHKKRLRDYDAALMAEMFGLDKKPEDMSIGLDYSKLRYLYDEEKIKSKLQEYTSEKGDVLFVEAGKYLTYGAAVHLDPVSMARYIDAKLILVMKGYERSIDDLTFVKKNLNLAEIDFRGIVFTNIQDVEDFKVKYLGLVEEMEIPVLGLLPYKEDLRHFSVEFLAKSLPAKIIAGEDGLHNTIKHIFVGAMYAQEAVRTPHFEKKNKLIITGGDRVDMILGSLNENTSAILLTNNVVPPPIIISKASSCRIPLLLVSADTYKTAYQVHGIEPLITAQETDKADLLQNLVKKHLKLDRIINLNY